jgi:hypothetical protein
MANALSGKTVLVMYDSTAVTNYQAVMVASIYFAASSTTVKDVAGLNDNAGTHAIHEYVLNAVSSGGTTGTTNYDTLALLWQKLKSLGTAVLAGTAPTTGTGSDAISCTAWTGTLVAGLTTVNYYQGMYINVTAGTAPGYYKVSTYATSNNVLTMGGAAVSFDNTSVCAMYNVPNLYVAQEAGRITTTTAYIYDINNATMSMSKALWLTIHTTNAPAWAIAMTSADYGWYHGQAASTQSSTTLGDSGASWTVNAYAGKWVYLVSGTGAGQWANILSNTATVLTCQYFNGTLANNGGTTWTTTPVAANTYYRIVDGFNEVFYPHYMQLYLKTYCFNWALNTTQDALKRLLDYGYPNGVENKPYGEPIIDTNFYKFTAFPAGKHMYDYVNSGAALVP